MVMATWLGTVLARTGYPVKAIDGWTTRGHGAMADVRGVLMHHTAGPSVGEYPSLNTVVNGRPDLPGPLCNFGLGRSGTLYLVAAGAAWHAGTGIWTNVPRDMGNQYLLGCEAESTGSGHDWTPAQIDCYKKACAEIMKYIGGPASMVVGHKEYCTPPGRKIDPAGIDMPSFRNDVAKIMSGASPTIPEQTLEEWMADNEDKVQSMINSAVNKAVAANNETQAELTRELIIAALNKRSGKDKSMGEFWDGMPKQAAPEISIDATAIANACEAAVTAALAGKDGAKVRAAFADTLITEIGNRVQPAVINDKFRRVQQYVEKVKNLQPGESLLHTQQEA